MYAFETTKYLADYMIHNNKIKIHSEGIARLGAKTKSNSITGKLSQKSLLGLFDEDEQAIKDVFIKTPYAQFVNECLRAKEKGLPFTQAEKMRDEYDSEYFAKRKYALEKNEPFLYYVYRRKAECANVRIVMVCLMAGLGEQDIKRRLRNF